MGEKVSRFEDLDVWKEGMSLTRRIYLILKDCRNYSLRDQMQRAAVSIPSNIAEGYERNTKKISAMLHNFIKVRKERF